jgi:cysteine-rich repeat protein
MSGAEQWDDGNYNNGDGCSSTCTVETNYRWVSLGPWNRSAWYLWGDGKREGTETCDDGNLISGDGCSSSCAVENGYSWTGGSPTTADTWNTVWGDGKKVGSEQCDDGDGSSGDGWSSSCTVEVGFSCSGGSSSTADTWNPIWGDSKRLGTEGWDDGNVIGGDGCSAGCTVETGWTWSGGSSTTADTCSPIWGDGKKMGSEQCDDGDLVSGDGWSSSCIVETGYSCSGGSSSTPDTWNPIWGDSKRIGSEGWDDGDLTGGDGCSGSWTVETGWTWSGGSPTTPDTCTEICGDGKRFNSVATYWDDGNNISGDGWTNGWAIEAGWSWSGGTTTTPDSWSEICGDGIRFNSLAAYCDDGGTSTGDGWDNNCAVETGWIWSGGSTSVADTCFEICGDGIRFNSISSYWDDGNTLSGDGCDNGWAIETGWLWSGGTTSTADGCTEIWGDGIRFNSLTTYWDDGNTNDNDGWSSLWAIELGWECTGGTTTTQDAWTEIWGDGMRFSNSDEYWDDGNLVDGDGCNNKCQVEDGWEWGGLLPNPSICSEIKSNIFSEENILIAIIALAMTLSAGASLMSWSFPFTIWQIMNLIQLLKYLLLLGIFIPERIDDIIESAGFMSMAVFLPYLMNQCIARQLLSLANFDEKGTNKVVYEFIDGEFSNVFTNVIIISVLGIIHLLLIPLKNCKKARPISTKLVVLKSVGTGLWNLFNLTVYIRIILQDFQPLTIIAASKLNKTDFSTDESVLSYALAAGVQVSCVGIFMLGLALWSYYRNNKEIPCTSWFSEFFVNQKNTKMARLYNVLLMSRRLFFSIWIFTFMSMSKFSYVLILVLYQISHLVLISIIRPFNNVKDNIVELIWEAIFTPMLFGLLHFNVKDKWDNTITSVYSGMIFFGCALIWLVWFSKIVVCSM